MILVTKFRVYDESTRIATPWHKYRAKVETVGDLKEVRQLLAKRLFNRPGNIELFFVEVFPADVHKSINIKAAKGLIK